MSYAASEQRFVNVGVAARRCGATWRPHSNSKIRAAALKQVNAQPAHLYSALPSAALWISFGVRCRTQSNDANRMVHSAGPRRRICGRLGCNSGAAVAQNAADGAPEAETTTEAAANAPTDGPTDGGAGRRSRARER